MIGIAIWQAFTQIFSIVHCGYQPVCEPCSRHRSYRHWMVLQPRYRQPGYGEIALGGPIASPACDVLDGFGRRHSPERTRGSERSTMNGPPMSTVGTQSACSSWTDPYGITHTYYIGDARSPPSPVTLSAFRGAEPWRIASMDCNAGGSRVGRRREGPEPWARRGRGPGANTPGWDRWRWTRGSR